MIISHGKGDRNGKKKCAFCENMTNNRIWVEKSRYYEFCCSKCRHNMIRGVLGLPIITGWGKNHGME